MCLLLSLSRVCYFLFRVFNDSFTRVCCSFFHKLASRRVFFKKLKSGTCPIIHTTIAGTWPFTSVGSILSTKRITYFRMFFIRLFKNSGRSKKGAFFPPQDSVRQHFPTKTKNTFFHLMYEFLQMVDIPRSRYLPSFQIHQLISSSC